MEMSYDTRCETKEEKLAAMRKAMAQKQYLEDLISTDPNPANVLRYENEIEELEEKIHSLKKRATSDSRPITVQEIYEKMQRYRSWIIVLLLLIVALILGAAVWLLTAYDDNFLQRENYDNERALRQSFESEKNLLQTEKESLEGEISSLKSENSNLQTKADWFDTSCKIVVADSGSLYKTYHTYDCDKWRGHSLWIYNKEQVINNYEYTKCPDCN